MPVQPPEPIWATIRDLEALRRTRSPRYARILAGILLLLFLVVLVILIFVPWQQTAYGTGRVIAHAPLNRQQIIEAPFEGRVVAWHVREGSEVAPGDRVATVRDLDPLILERLQQERRAIRQRLQAAQDRADRLGDRITQLENARENAVSAAGLRARMSEDRVEAAGQAVEAARARVVTARLNLARQRALAEQGLAATRAVELARLEHEQAQAELQRAQAALAAARKEVGTLTAEQARVRAEITASLDDARATRQAALAEAANVRADLTRLEGRLARQQSQDVVAPREGVILRLVATEGAEIVKGGDPLAILVPRASIRAAELWIDGINAPLIRQGQEARIQFEGWPALQAAGWPSLAIGTFAGRVELVDAAANEDGQLRILVTPAPNEAWPAQDFLRQGMLARGWVLLSQVPIGWEIWRLFNGFPAGLGPGTQYLEGPEVLELKKRK